MANQLKAFKSVKRKELEKELNELKEFDHEQTYWSREAFNVSLNNFDGDTINLGDSKPKQS